MLPVYVKNIHIENESRNRLSDMYKELKLVIRLYLIPQENEWKFRFEQTLHLPL